MKNVFYILGITSLASAYSCKKPADACFTYSPSVINTYTDVVFDASCSENAGRYVWYFGDDADGEPTDELTITHRFEVPGEYMITLGIQKADGKKSGRDKLVFQQSITVQ